MLSLGAHRLGVRDRLFYHIAWTTRDRQPLIEAAVAEFLARYLPSVARQERTRILELGIVRTHLHLLIKTHPTTSIPRLLQRFKGGSATLANREGHASQGELRWAKGYNIETVGPRSIDAVGRYVRNQAMRHPAEAIAGFDVQTSLSATD